MFQLRRPSAEEVTAFIATQRGATFSYPEVGATKSGAAPAGYDVDRNRVRLGTGAETFRRATTAVHAWRMSSIGWMSIQPANAPLSPSETVAAVVSHYGFWSLNACRVVYLLARLGSPLARRLQRRFARESKQAMLAAVG